MVLPLSNYFIADCVGQRACSTRGDGDGVALHQVDRSRFVHSNQRRIGRDGHCRYNRVSRTARRSRTLGYSAVGVHRHRSISRRRCGVSHHNLIDLKHRAAGCRIRHKNNCGCTARYVVSRCPKNGRYVDYVGICHDGSLEAEDH
jgi:hypothetical protein